MSDREESALELPLVGSRDDGIIDFARVYRRSRGDQGMESMNELPKEFSTNSELQRQPKVETEDEDLVREAPDQTHLLQSSHARDESSSGFRHVPLNDDDAVRERRGKPMLRFTKPTTAPFLEAAEVECNTRRRIQLLQDGGSDELYSKIEQVPWEDDIQWGSDNEKKRDHDDAKKSSTAPPANTYSRSTSAAETMWVPDMRQQAFDMTKPGLHRWEIDGESSRPKATAPRAPKANAQDLPCVLNEEFERGDWVRAIGWEATWTMPDSQLVLDENDTHLIFLTKEMEELRPTLRIPERKLGAAEKKRQENNAKLTAKNHRIKDVMDHLEFGDEVAENKLGTEGGKKPSNSRVKKSIGYVHHSMPAIKLTLTKPELPKSKLRDFHRPRGRFKINEHVAFAPPQPTSSKAPKNDSSVVAQIKKSSDLNPTAGGKLVMIEYTEQNPPVLSNLGMASRILHYWRAPEDEEKTLETAFKKRPKKSQPKPPDMKMGQVITLGERDESPFVGDVPPGRVVTSLNSKLFKVPLFKHKPRVPYVKEPGQRSHAASELFLLCRSASKKKGLGVPKSTMYVLELPDTYLAGQIEPQMEVPAPNSRSANDFIRPYMSFHILRLFKKASDGERLKIEDIARAFPNQSSTATRKRMKEVATFERGGNDSGWWKKKPTSMLTSEEELADSISPESVCLYESMMAGHRKLMDIGLTRISMPTGVNTAINHLLKRLEVRKKTLSQHIIEPRGLDKRAKERAKTALFKTDPVVRKLEKEIQVGRYIYEQLQLTPWNLTNNYVECHLQGKGSGMLKLRGLGDPTGRGEGFSFVRVPQSRAKKRDGEDDGAGNAAGSTAVKDAVAAVTGTAADLRKLKMKEAGDVLRNLGLADEDIKKLKRWDRIHMVRELSSRATAHGMAGPLSKFARGARKSLSAQQQEYRKRCDEIYACQMNVLSSEELPVASDEESDGEDDMFDELTKDLEDDIIGSSNGDNKIAKRGPKNIFSKGGGGLNRTVEAVAEREDAAELRKLLRDMKEDAGERRPDVDSSQLRSQLQASGIESSSASRTGASRGESGFNSATATPPSQTRASSPSMPTPQPSARPTKKALMRTTRTIKEDGSEDVKIEFITDERQVREFQRQEARHSRKDNATNRKRKRVLGAEEDAAKKRKQLQDELRQLQRTEEQNKGYQEMLQKQGQPGSGAFESTPPRGGIRCTQCGQVGHMRTNRNCPLYMASSEAKPKKEEVVDADGKITVNLSELREGARRANEEKKRKRLQEQQEQAEIYRRPYLNNVVKQSRSRMPKEQLNETLGQVVDNLIGMPESEIFRAAVNPEAVPGYYQFIKHPIDLGAIKQKTEKQEYDLMRDFVKDLELMVSNSKAYNGDPSVSVITQNAVLLQKKAQEELSQVKTEGGYTPRD